MSKSDAMQRILRVTSSDDGVRITILDQGLKPLAQGTGVLTHAVIPGLYSVRFDAGSSMREQIVKVEPGAGIVPIDGDPVPFASAAPLPYTKFNTVGQQDAAARMSRKRHRQLGSGGSLMVFVRDMDRLARTPPTRGLTLHNPSSDQRANIERDSESEDGRDGQRLPWSAATYELAPGSWRLCCPSPGGRAAEQTIVVCQDWQTQVFLQRRASQAGRGRRPDLADACVLMAPIEDGFDPEREGLRSAELARKSLRDHRAVVPTHEIEQMLFEKADNPMVAIYGAHLMMQRAEPDIEFMGTVVDNLTELIGDHPDVRALQLSLGRNDLAGEFAQPPMLKSSWSLIIDASADLPHLVPLDSTSATIAERALSGGPWLRWRDASTTRQPRVVSTREALSLAGEFATIARRVADDAETEIPRRTRASTTEAKILSLAREAHRHPALRCETQQIDDRDVIRALGVPRSVAEEAMRKVSRSLMRD